MPESYAMYFPGEAIYRIYYHLSGWVGIQNAYFPINATHQAPPSKALVLAPASSHHRFTRCEGSKGDATVCLQLNHSPPHVTHPSPLAWALQSLCMYIFLLRLIKQRVRASSLAHLFPFFSGSRHSRFRGMASALSFPFSHGQPSGISPSFGEKY